MVCTKSAAARCGPHGAKEECDSGQRRRDPDSRHPLPTDAFRPSSLCEVWRFPVSSVRLCLRLRFCFWTARRQQCPRVWCALALPIFRLKTAGARKRAPRIVHGACAPCLVLSLDLTHVPFPSSLAPSPSLPSSLSLSPLSLAPSRPRALPFPALPPCPSLPSSLFLPRPFPPLFSLPLSLSSLRVHISCLARTRPRPGRGRWR